MRALRRLALLLRFHGGSNVSVSPPLAKGLRGLELPRSRGSPHKFAQFRSCYVYSRPTCFTADMFPPGLALVGFLDPLWKLLMAEAQANINIMNKCNSSGMPMKFLHQGFHGLSATHRSMLQYVTECGVSSPMPQRDGANQARILGCLRCQDPTKHHQASTSINKRQMEKMKNVWLWPCMLWCDKSREETNPI